MIFVDTSVWIQYFRGNDPVLVTKCQQLLDDEQIVLSNIAWLEILSGARKSELFLLKRVLSALPRFSPTTQTWGKIEDWIQIGREKGHRFSVTDLLIAAIADENDGQLWTLDADYSRMKELGFIKLFA